MTDTAPTVPARDDVPTMTAKACRAFLDAHDMPYRSRDSVTALRSAVLDTLDALDAAPTVTTVTDEPIPGHEDIVVTDPPADDATADEPTPEPAADVDPDAFPGFGTDALTDAIRAAIRDGNGSDAANRLAGWYNAVAVTQDAIDQFAAAIAAATGRASADGNRFGDRPHANVGPRPSSTGENGERLPFGRLAPITEWRPALTTGGNGKTIADPNEPHRCDACGATLPAKKFPTKSLPAGDPNVGRIRLSECRADRDRRYAAYRDAKAAAAAGDTDAADALAGSAAA